MINKPVHNTHTNLTPKQGGGGGDDVTVMCPICRDEVRVAPSPPPTTEEATPTAATTPPPSITLTRRQHREQDTRRRLFARQLRNDGIIDVEKERNRYLITAPPTPIVQVVYQLVKGVPQSSSIGNERSFYIFNM